MEITRTVDKLSLVKTCPGIWNLSVTRNVRSQLMKYVKCYYMPIIGKYFDSESTHKISHRKFIFLNRIT